MTAPTFRSVDAHTGSVAPRGIVPTVREIDALRDEITTLKAQLKDEQDGARVEIDNLTDLLKTSGKQVSNLSTTLAMYQVERDEARDERDEYRDRFDLACEERDEARTRIGELMGELTAALSERDLARSERDTWRAGVSAVAR